MKPERFKALLDTLSLKIYNYRTGQEEPLDFRGKTVEQLCDYLPDATARSTFKILLDRGWTKWDAMTQARSEYYELHPEKMEEEEEGEAD
jgi:hypothetical protein